MSKIKKLLFAIIGCGAIEGLLLFVPKYISMTIMSDKTYKNVGLGDFSLMTVIKSPGMFPSQSVAMGIAYIVLTLVCICVLCVMVVRNKSNAIAPLSIKMLGALCYVATAIFVFKEPESGDLYMTYSAGIGLLLSIALMVIEIVLLLYVMKSNIAVRADDAS